MGLVDESQESLKHVEAKLIAGICCFKENDETDIKTRE